MDLGEFKKMFESQANQSVNGQVSVGKHRSAFIYANMMFFKKQVGIEDVPNDGPYWQKCQQVTDSLMPFIVGMGEDNNAMLKVNSSGYATIPQDYYMYSSLTLPLYKDQSTCTMIESEYEIDMLTDEMFQARITSARKKPSLKKPICTPRNNQLRFEPKGIVRAKMVYLRRPAVPFMDYDEVDGVFHYLPPGTFHNGSIPGKPEGTPSASVEFEWPEKYHIELYAIYASFLSDNLGTQAVKQSSESVKRTGL